MGKGIEEEGFGLAGRALGAERDFNLIMPPGGTWEENRIVHLTDILSPLRLRPLLCLGGSACCELCTMP